MSITRSISLSQAPVHAHTLPHGCLVAVAFVTHTLGSRRHSNRHEGFSFAAKLGCKLHCVAQPRSLKVNEPDWGLCSHVRSSSGVVSRLAGGQHISSMQLARQPDRCEQLQTESPYPFNRIAPATDWQSFAHATETAKDKSKFRPC